MNTPSFGLTATERVLPKLALDFTTASLDNRITFTRTTGASNPATYVNSSGVLTAATNNQPRFDYDPVTLACKGLLIEESRTNKVPYSEDFTQATWTKGPNTTLTGGQPGDPTGGSNATRLQMPTGAGTYIYRLDTLTAASYTITVYARLRSGYSTGVFRLGASTTIVALADANSVACTTTSTWQRFTYTFTATAAQWYVGIDSIDSTTALDIEIFGFQNEAGAFATSYIPTTSAALTRNADVATMTGTNFSDWYNQSEGAFVIWFDTRATVQGGAFSLNNGSSSQRIDYRAGGASGYVFINGASAMFLGAANNGNLFKASVAIKDVDFAGQRTSGTFRTSASAIPTGLSTLNIGSLDSAANFLNGHVAKIFYYPQRVSNAEVQAQVTS